MSTSVAHDRRNLPRLWQYGDSVSLSGELSPKTWTDREGMARPALDLVAHAVLTPYHVTRRRQAVTGACDA